MSKNKAKDTNFLSFYSRSEVVRGRRILCCMYQASQGYVSVVMTDLEVRRPKVKYKIWVQRGQRNKASTNFSSFCVISTNRFCVFIPQPSSYPKSKHMVARWSTRFLNIYLKFRILWLMNNPLNCFFSNIFVDKWMLIFVLRG